MGRTWKRGMALTAVAGLLLVGCSSDQADPEQTGTQTPDGDTGTPSSTEAMPDVDDNIEDGVYRGNGVALPVPDGWQVDPTALAQGLVAAVSAEGDQQMTAQAVDTSEVEAAGGAPMDLDALLENVRQSIGQEPTVDEPIELDGAVRAHRLTYLSIPSQQEGAPEASATILLAEDGDGVVGEFMFSALASAYDESYESLLLGEAGFDPNSEPPSVPQAPQAPPATDEG